MDVDQDHGIDPDPQNDDLPVNPPTEGPHQHQPQELHHKLEPESEPELEFSKADEIALAVTKKFAQSKEHGKPQKENKEWTVLAGIVLEEIECGNFTNSQTTFNKTKLSCIVFATGTRCLSPSLLVLPPLVEEKAGEEEQLEGAQRDEAAPAAAPEVAQNKRGRGKKNKKSALASTISTTASSSSFSSSSSSHCSALEILSPVNKKRSKKRKKLRFGPTFHQLQSEQNMSKLHRRLTKTTNRLPNNWSIPDRPMKKPAVVKGRKQDENVINSPFRDLVLRDCHAEVLAQRGFKLWLLRNPEKAKWYFEGKARFHFYTSCVPCGEAANVEMGGGNRGHGTTDSSPDELLHKSGTAATQEPSTSASSSFTSSSSSSFLASSQLSQAAASEQQTQEKPQHYTYPLKTGAKPVELQQKENNENARLGKATTLHTKPIDSRSDPSKRSKCMSCADKICRWNACGWDGGVLAAPLYGFELMNKKDDQHGLSTAAPESSSATSEAAAACGIRMSSIVIGGATSFDDFYSAARQLDDFSKKKYEQKLWDVLCGRVLQMRHEEQCDGEDAGTTAASSSSRGAGGSTTGSGTAPAHDVQVGVADVVGNTNTGSKVDEHDDGYGFEPIPLLSELDDDNSTQEEVEAETAKRRKVTENKSSDGETSSQGQQGAGAGRSSAVSSTTAASTSGAAVQQQGQSSDNETSQGQLLGAGAGCRSAASSTTSASTSGAAVQQQQQVDDSQEQQQEQNDVRRERGRENKFQVPLQHVSGRTSGVLAESLPAVVLTNVDFEFSQRNANLTVHNHCPEVVNEGVLLVGGADTGGEMKTAAGAASSSSSSSQAKRNKVKRPVTTGYSKIFVEGGGLLPREVVKDVEGGPGTQDAAHVGEQQPGSLPEDAAAADPAAAGGSVLQQPSSSSSSSSTSSPTLDNTRMTSSTSGSTTNSPENNPTQQEEVVPPAPTSSSSGQAEVVAASADHVPSMIQQATTNKNTIKVKPKRPDLHEVILGDYGLKQNGRKYLPGFGSGDRETRERINASLTREVIALRKFGGIPITSEQYLHGSEYEAGVQHFVEYDPNIITETELYWTDYVLQKCYGKFTSLLCTMSLKEIEKDVLKQARKAKRKIRKDYTAAMMSSSSSTYAATSAEVFQHGGKTLFEVPAGAVVGSFVDSTTSGLYGIRSTYATTNLHDPTSTSALLSCSKSGGEDAVEKEFRKAACGRCGYKERKMAFHCTPPWEGWIRKSRKE
ncbi:unnamed protein product [Amoebophrya sp. A120]|nr:unnamed protein product [Amoebophrya sp. A120]|eukprot:GSA120T00004723001.1